MSKRQLMKHKKEVKEMIAQWQTVLRFLSEDSYRISCIYEEKLRSTLETEPMLKIWSENWGVPEFGGYRELRWVELLMPFATQDYFVILGDADCLPELLYQHAGKMRGIRWILEKRQDTQWLQDFLDDFYDETGIAVTVEFIQDETADEGTRKVMWRCLSLSSSFPVNILDFSGENRISAGSLPRGSIWLDMDSSEEKEERITAGNSGVSYFSLRKDCFCMQKALFYRQKELFCGQNHSYCLDRASKNGYNTEVN